MDNKVQSPKTPTVRIEQAPDEKTMNKETSALSSVVLIIAVALVVLAGVSTGYALAHNKGGVTSIIPGASNGTLGTATGNTIGKLEEGVQYDEVDGTLVQGGIDSEGTHHLERDGGPSQNVYLTSSTINLDAYLGKTVKVWGMTNAAQKAGWLMDVAKLEVK